MRSTECPFSYMLKTRENQPSFKGRYTSKTDIKETVPHIDDSASKKLALTLLHLSFCVHAIEVCIDRQSK